MERGAHAKDYIRETDLPFLLPFRVSIRARPRTSPLIDSSRAQIWTKLKLSPLLDPFISRDPENADVSVHYDAHRLDEGV